MSKPYTPRTLNTALRHIEGQREYIKVLEEQATKLRHQCGMLAKLSADGPMFYSPLDAVAAKTIRDNALRELFNMKPDGTFITGGTPQ